MKKVITYGTFDLFHQGHYNIIKRAKDLGDYLIVGVTGENYDVERGKIGVQDSLPQRIENVRKTGLADEIIVEEFQGQKIQDVQNYNVDVLVVGSDWRGKFDYLKEYCDVVYLERTKDISSTMIRQQQQHLQIGMILDSADDKGFVLESKYVSGIHVDRVFNPDAEIANQACQNYELRGAYSNLDEFFDGINTVYIQGDGKSQLPYIRPALEAGKHVLLSFPALLEEDEFRSLLNLSKEKNVILLPCVKMSYIQALNQMFWMIESGSIGKVLNMHCSMFCNDVDSHNLSELQSYGLYAFYKLFKNQSADFHLFKNPIEENGFYLHLQARMEKAAATMEISDSIDLPNKLVIYGDKGVITLPDEWWNTGYFEIKHPDNEYKKRYCYNFEGNGMRYILQRLLIMLREQKDQNMRFTNDDFVNFNKLYNQLFK